MPIARIGHRLARIEVSKTPISTHLGNVGNDLGGTTHHASGPNVQQVTLEAEDHFAVAASRNSFIATWKYLYGKAPKYDTIQCGEAPVTIEGIAETFGDNVPISNAKGEIYELDYSGPPRDRGKPVKTVTTEADGHFGPIQLKRNVPYEFKAYDSAGKLVGYVYFSPFKRSNRLTRLLKPSDFPLISMMSTNNIVRSAKSTAVIGRYLGGAFRKDLKNTFKINGEEVLTDANAGKAASVVGFFMYDANDDGKTNLSAPTFGPMSFVVGSDFYMDASSPKWLEIEWSDPTNGNDPMTMKIPNWPSDSALDLLYLQ